MVCLPCSFSRFQSIQIRRFIKLVSAKDNEMMFYHKNRGFSPVPQDRAVNSKACHIRRRVPVFHSLRSVCE
ncbi:hypothetical protein HOE425_331754 [Hoeflea sp. EC-HK425]|nr:hypothetical protein HOE425_331754 [Hoeflea sp. EC-HK425]